MLHLRDHVAQHTVRVMTPEQAQRVEHIAENPSLQKRGDGAAAQVDAVVGEEVVNALPQCVVGRAVEVVGGLESGERPEPSRQLRQPVDVDIPAVASVFEVVVHRSTAQMRYPGPIQRRGQHATTSALRAVVGHCAPRRRAARSPDAAPSSWNPQP